MQNDEKCVYLVRENITKNGLNFKNLKSIKNVNKYNIETIYGPESCIEEAKNNGSKDYRQTPAILSICKGAQIMLTQNLNTNIGLSNGSQGEIYDIVFDKDKKVQYILLQMNETYTGPSFIPDVPRIVVIKRYQIRGGKKSNYWCEQFPIILAYSFI